MQIMYLISDRYSEQTRESKIYAHTKVCTQEFTAKKKEFTATPLIATLLVTTKKMNGQTVVGPLNAI